MAVTGCGGGDSDGTATSSSKAVIKLESVPGLGRVLVNSSGKTLYRFSKDIKWNDLTMCNNACAEVWEPELTTAKPAAGPGGVESFKLDTFKRRDGSTQATYDGWPLYTYTGEESGEGQGAGMHSRGGIWYALAGAKAVSIEG